MSQLEVLKQEREKKMKTAASVQVGLAFDTTGSMRSVLRQVRDQNGRLIAGLFNTIPMLEIAGLAIGDDGPREGGGYMTKTSPFMRDWDSCLDWFKKVPDAYGGDEDECYEQALRDLNGLPWEPYAQKVVVFVGDAFPHPVSHRKNPLRLDWKQEAAELARKGVVIHAVQCLSHYGGRGDFWKQLATIGNGVHLRLDQWSHLESLLLGVAHFIKGGAAGLGTWESGRGQMPASVTRSFDALAGRKARTRARTDGRKPIETSRFQVLTVGGREKQDVRDFAVEMGLISNPTEYAKVVKGHLYYAHTEKSEELRKEHQVVIQDKNTDEFFSGDTAREWLGCPFGESLRIKPNPLGPDYTVWFQSKSMNRKLMPGQEVMVEMTDMMRSLA